MLRSALKARRKRNKEYWKNKTRAKDEDEKKEEEMDEGVRRSLSYAKPGKPGPLSGVASLIHRCPSPSPPACRNPLFIMSDVLYLSIRQSKRHSILRIAKPRAA